MKGRTLNLALIFRSHFLGDRYFSPLVLVATLSRRLDHVRGLVRKSASWASGVGAETLLAQLTLFLYIYYLISVIIKNAWLANKQYYLKMGKGLELSFSKEDKQMANNHMRCSSSLIIRDMKIKATGQHTLHPLVWLPSKQPKQNQTDRNKQKT